MVFVLDKHKKPLMPCSEKRARQLLEQKRAVIHKMYPFTIRLKDRTREESYLQPLRLKIDPGSKTTGIAVLNEEDVAVGKAVFLAEIHHKPGIKDKLDTRRALRRGRRTRKLRYREARFLNRKRGKGWLPPSLTARVNQTMSAVNKLQKSLPITAISTEHIKFDTQLMQNPNISGVEYQQGELFGYEVKEYLLEKFCRECAYCNKKDVPLEVEHVVPKNPNKGLKGTDRISNLTIACEPCNKHKDNLQPEEWLEKLQKSNKEIDKLRAKNLPKVMKMLKQPLKDAAMMNATRWALLNRLKETGLPIECGTGARTKYNRTQKNLPKTHYYDACCVANTPESLAIQSSYVQLWSATGRGTRKMCNVDKYGFPKSHRTRQKKHFGFQTGDMVKANIPKGKYEGVYLGRVAVRKNGYFDVKGTDGKRLCQGVSHKYCQLIQRADGWQYEKTPHIPPHA